MDKTFRDLLNKTDFDNKLNSMGYAYFKEGDYNLNIIGVRNMLTSKLVSGSDYKYIKQRDQFDDALIVTRKENGKWVRNTWELTTDPGLKLLKAPSNSKGTAILVPGQYRGVYRMDIHNGKYKALCQRNGYVSVYRDNNKDNNLDLNPRTIRSGMFGINIHRAGMQDSTMIGSYSAGCQVFAHVFDFYDFMELLEKSASIYGNKFTYTLITSDDLI